MHNRDVLLNDFAIRSLRNTADKDYIHARLAYRAKLVPQFLWSSLHCLEKYGKCILLLNRINGLGIKHELSESLERVNQSSLFSITLPEQSLEFLNRLESCARFRYLEVSWFNEQYDLFRLDELASTLRRYCQPLSDSMQTTDSKKFSLLNANLKKIKQAELENYRDSCIQHGVLEQILAEKTNPARQALVWNNLYFGSSKRKSVRIQLYWESENAPLYLHPEILEEVIKYIHLPREVIDAYKNHIPD